MKLDEDETDAEEKEDEEEAEVEQEEEEESEEESEESESEESGEESGSESEAEVCFFTRLLLYVLKIYIYLPVSLRMLSIPPRRPIWSHVLRSTRVALLL